MAKKSNTSKPLPAAYTRKLTSTKLDQIAPENMVQIKSSADSFRIAWSLWDLETIEVQESAYVLMLNSALKVIGWAQLSTGGTNGTIIDEKLLFTHALLCGCNSIILYHNHPSGTLSPSQADIRLTKKVKAGGEILGIILMDHIIVCGENSYYSFADQGNM